MKNRSHRYDIRRTRPTSSLSLKSVAYKKKCIILLVVQEQDSTSSQLKATSATKR